MPYANIDEIRDANERAGRYWFAPDAMRCFGTQVHQTVYGGRVFVTSERDPHGSAWDGERRYSIRIAQDDGSIRTVGEFGQYASASAAHSAARRIASNAGEWV